MSREEVEKLIAERRKQELRDTYEEVAPGVFAVPRHQKRTREGLERVIKRRTWEQSLRKQNGLI